MANGWRDHNITQSRDPTGILRVVGALDVAGGQLKQCPAVDLIRQETGRTTGYPGNCGGRGEQICSDLGAGVAAPDYQHPGSAELVAGAVIGGVQLCPGELCGPGDEGHEGAAP